jgi:AcrR family transcriptional regulator
MGRRPDIDGRELLLEAALRLFAQQGVEGVSIRAVNRAAGLGPASVHYHFGTKEALVEAVLHRYGDVVIDRIKARAKELNEPGGHADARDLVTMLAEPYLDLIATNSDEGRAWVRLMGQLLQQDSERVLDRPSARLTWGAAARVFPDASPADIQRAMRMCVVLLVTQLAQAPRSGRGALDVELLVDFLSAGLDAVLGRVGGVGNARAGGQAIA